MTGLKEGDEINFYRLSYKTKEYCKVKDFGRIVKVFAGYCDVYSYKLCGVTKVVNDFIIEKMENLTVSKERIIAVAKENPCAAKVLEGLFPEAFEDNTVFCKIGITFKRNKYLKNTYALFKWNGEVRVLNITQNKMWKPERNLKVSSLKDLEGNTLTVSEFKRLSGYHNLTEFIFETEG